MIEWTDAASDGATSRAPWSDEQVANLADRQMAPVHSYTCVTHTMGSLIPTRLGWVCPYSGCTYRQDWAYVLDTRERWWER